MARPVISAAGASSPCCGPPCCARTRVIFVDDFDRPNGPLTAPWRLVDGFSSPEAVMPRIVGGEATGTAAAGEVSAAGIDLSCSGIFDFEIHVGHVGTALTFAGFLTDPPDTFVGVQWSSGAPLGFFGPWTYTTNPTIVDGDTIRLIYTATGDLYAYVNGTFVAAALAAGAPGAGIFIGFVSAVSPADTGTIESVRVACLSSFTGPSIPFDTLRITEDGEGRVTEISDWRVIE